MVEEFCSRKLLTPAVTFYGKIPGTKIKSFERIYFTALKEKNNNT